MTLNKFLILFKTNFPLKISPKSSNWISLHVKEKQSALSERLKSKSSRKYERFFILIYSHNLRENSTALWMINHYRNQRRCFGRLLPTSKDIRGASSPNLSDVVLKFDYEWEEKSIYCGFKRWG
ncbi:hypothetical protein CDAR_529121 [Caerostris darwini]|uniref:Ycf15 n=1 Tax=Caerostris darwini TaxID=1538125 RepID=A0AAV4UD85_9ARAC|nr:hypothetical protein CDAR_529121 [Caerostris darwini]